jgi:hypothetical protein
VDDVSGQLTAVRDALRFQADLARDASEEEFVSVMNARAEQAIDDQTGRRLFDAGNPADFYAGLRRYWSRVQAA